MTVSRTRIAGLTRNEILGLPDDVKLEMMRSGNRMMLDAVSDDPGMSREIFEFFLKENEKMRMQLLRKAVGSYHPNLTEEDMELIVFGALPGGEGSSHEKQLHEITCAIILLRPDAPSKLVDELTKRKHGDNANRFAFMHENLSPHLLIELLDEFIKDEKAATKRNPLIRCIKLNPSLRLDGSHPLKLISEVAAELRNSETPARLNARNLLDQVRKEVKADMFNMFSPGWDGSLDDFITAMKELDKD